MTIIFPWFRWGWLLIIALFIPISLPAGGVQKNLNEVFRSYSSPQTLAGGACSFRSSPSTSAIILRKVSLGTPIHILRKSDSPDGESWLYVQISSFPLLEVNYQPKRGWIAL